MKRNVFILREFKDIYMTVTYTYDIKLSRWLRWRIQLGCRLIQVAAWVMNIPCKVTLERKAN